MTGTVLFHTLAHYSAFVAKVREYEQDGANRAEAIEKAVYYCRNNDILKEYLEKHASEVVNMLMTEWNWDDAKQVWFEEGIEEGIEQGIEQERKFIIDLINQGLTAEQIKNQLEAK